MKYGRHTTYERYVIKIRKWDIPSIVKRVKTFSFFVVLKVT